MKRIILLGLLAASSALAAPKVQHVAKPQPMPQQTDEQRAEAEKAKKIEVGTNAIREALNDPESARFRNVILSPKGRAVCGEINAKNKMGGYVGFRRFIVAADQSGIEEDDTSFVESNWQSRCVKDVLYSEIDVAK